MIFILLIIVTVVVLMILVISLSLKFRKEQERQDTAIPPMNARYRRTNSQGNMGSQQNIVTATDHHEH